MRKDAKPAPLAIIAERAAPARLVARDPTNPRDVLAAAANALQDAVASSHAARDFATMVRAVDCWTRITGARAADVVQLRAREDDAAARFMAMAPAERCEVLREQIATLTGLLEKQRAELGEGEP